MSARISLRRDRFLAFDPIIGLISALPPIHELAKQAGIRLPTALGKVDDDDQPGQKAGK